MIHVRATAELVERLDAVARVAGASRSGVARLWLAERVIEEDVQKAAGTGECLTMT